jgi:phosphonopyruvate decarboxylase
VIDPLELLDALRARGIAYYAGVPDSLLKEFIACIADRCSPTEHLIAANEGGAVAAAIGYHLATGRTPLVYMQNSGLGNAVNPLLSLADPEVYGIPMLLLVGWRGEPGTRDEPQHRAQGVATLPLLDAMRIPYTILEAQTRDFHAALRKALPAAPAGPHALVVRAGAFRAGTPPPSAAPGPALAREEAIAIVADAVAPDAVVVATTGMISRELYEHRARLGQGHERDFLVVGGMGHAAQIAQAIAAQRPGRKIWCLDGDGALLMHMGSLAVIGASGATNFHHVVLNNGAHESVGGQPTVASGIDMPTLACAAGYSAALRADDPDRLRRSLDELRVRRGPTLLEVRVARGHRADLGRPQWTPLEGKRALMNHLR